MRLKTLPTTQAGWLAGAAMATLAAASTFGGCSNSDPVPFCENCENWVQLTPGLARFPDPHPSLPNLYAYSTIQKNPGSSDSQRESDEDIWLLLVADPQNPAANRTLQVTGDEVSTGGDNFAPRWSPDGTQILFVHSRDIGGLQVWRVSIDAFGVTAAGGTPVIGTPEMLLPNARDPEWIAEDEILFTRGDKLFRVPVGPAPAPGRGGVAPTQLSFNPPVFASSDDYVDRHPDVASDGGALFGTQGRQPVGNIFVEAMEPDSGGVDPAAFLLLQAPGATPNYPLFEGADTLQTPILLRSLPLDGGSQFKIGVRIDRNFYPQPDSLHPPVRLAFYCDTTITKILDLEAGQTNSVAFTFEHARGSLRIVSGLPLTTFSWIRSDMLVTNTTITGRDTESLPSVGDRAAYDCLLSYEVRNGVPDPPNLENYVITAHAPPDNDTTAVVTIAPAETTRVSLFPGPGPPDPARSTRVTSASGASKAPRLSGAQLGGLRVDDVSAIWQLEVPATGDADFHPISGSAGSIQHPALSREFSGRVRYVSYVSDESGDWQLYVQRIQVGDVNGQDRFVADGAPYRVPTPGSIDNLNCTRSVFYPRFVPTNDSSTLRIVVGMGDCPNNGFEDLGSDDDPWALGEYRLWEVAVPRSDLP